METVCTETLRCAGLEVSDDAFDGSICTENDGMDVFREDRTRQDLVSGFTDCLGEPTAD